MLYYTDPGCLAHDVMPDHPERPDRLRAIDQELRRTGLLQELQVQRVQPMDLARATKAHSAEHVAFLQQMAPTTGTVSIDPDTHMCEGSLAAAQLAAGAVTQAVDAVLHGQDARAFCAVRPPGHHAEHNDAMGFCLFNSIALGALSALEHPGVERVAILDFDVHHGNGTVDIFRDDPRVLVCSSYQHPFYPNRMADVQASHLVHTPLAAGTRSRDFRLAIEQSWLPALEQHKPQLVLVSAGFDAHRDDPLAQIELATEDYGWITELILSAARSSAEGRVVSALEGGYDLKALAASASLHVQTLLQAP